MDTEKIKTAAKQLHEMGVKVTPIMLKLASSKDAEEKIMNYFHKANGCYSLADFWAKKLNCSEDEMYKLFKENRRMFTRNGVVKYSKKVDILFELGYTVEEVKDCSHIIYNVNTASLVRRCQQFKDMGWEKPQIQALSQADVSFEKYVKNRSQTLEEREYRLKSITEILGITRETVLQLPRILSFDFDSIQAKILFLMQVGISPLDILEHAGESLRLSLDKLKQGYADFCQLGLNKNISLRDLASYAQNGQVSRRITTPLFLANQLNCSVADLTKRTRGYRVIWLQSRHVMAQNREFLCECGFTNEHIVDCPIILGHDPEVLQYHWSTLPQKKELQPFSTWMEKPAKLLQMLQYFIEKDINFSYPICLNKKISPSINSALKDPVNVTK